MQNEKKVVQYEEKVCSVRGTTHAVGGQGV